MKKIMLIILFSLIININFVYCSDYSYTRLYLNTNKAYINKIQYLLSEKTDVAFSPTKMYEVVSILSNKLKTPIYVEKGLENVVINIVQENILISDLLEKIQNQSNSFLIYRNGYLLFSKKLEAIFTLNSPITKNYLKKLAKNIINTKSRIFIDNNKLIAKLDRFGLNNLRSFLIENNLKTKILSTDAVLPIGTLE